MIVYVIPVSAMLYPTTCKAKIIKCNDLSLINATPTIPIASTALPIPKVPCLPISF